MIIITSVEYSVIGIPFTGRPGNDVDFLIGVRTTPRRIAIKAYDRNAHHPPKKKKKT